MVVNEQLVQYIRDQLNSGYDINSIRYALISYGWDQAVVDECISYIYYPPVPVYPPMTPPTPPITVIPKIPKAAFLIGGALIAVIMISVFAFMMISKPAPLPKTLLDVETQIITEEIYAGEVMEFNLDIYNIGGTARYDVQITHQIIDSENRLIATKTETAGIETRMSKITSIRLPKDTPAGRYTLKTFIIYDGQRAESATEFDILEEEAPEVPPELPPEAPPSPIENITECPVDCDDDNDCTEDVCDESNNFTCENRPITPCCGNLDCETGETEESCPEDCRVEIELPDNPLVRLQTIVDVSYDDIEKAAEMCNAIRNKEERDECFLEIAKSNENKELCNQINTTVIADDCYFFFAMAGDKEICAKITDANKKKNCLTLASMVEMQQKVVPEALENASKLAEGYDFEEVPPTEPLESPPGGDESENTTSI